MRIIKTVEEDLAEKKVRKIANIECRKCPCCGEMKTDIEYSLEGDPQYRRMGVSAVPLYIIRKNGISRTQYIRIDGYKCYTCGLEWESDPYEER